MAISPPQTPQAAQAPSRQSSVSSPSRLRASSSSQEVLVEARVHGVAPVRAVHTGLAETDAGGRRGRLPVARVEVLAPPVEASACPPGLFDQPVRPGPPRASVASTVDAATSWNATRTPRGTASRTNCWRRRRVSAPANGSSSNGVCALGT